MSLLKNLSFYILLFITTLLQQLSAQERDTLVPVEYYFENGQVSSKGTLRQGKPDGYWISYYQNGNIKTEGNREHYKLTGTWKFYSPEGILSATIDYKEDQKDGFRVTYRGKTEAKREAFKADVKNGNTVEYHSNGSVKSIIPFVNGREKGLGYIYDTAGTVISLKTFKAGVLVKDQDINRYDESRKRTGLWMTFYPDMNIRNEGLYVNDLKHGYWKYYNKDGNLLRIEKWINGVLVDDAQEVAKIDIRRTINPETGKLQSIGGYRNNKKEGIHRTYDDEGNVIASAQYANGILLAQGIFDEQGRKQGMWKYFYEDGTLKEEGKYRNNKKEGTWKYYFPDGTIEQIGDFNNDLPEGTWRWYYANKQLRLEEEYIDGYEEGPSIEYSDSGQVIAQGNYVEGFKDGIWTYMIGSIKESGKYFEGEKQGTWTQQYLDNGKIAFEGDFLNGIENGIHKYYHPNGLPKRRGKYTLGIRDGLWEYLDERGNVRLTIRYENGEEVELNGEKITYGKRVDRELEADKANQ